MIQKPPKTTHADLLQETLDEEKETDKKLTHLSKEVNIQALDGSPQREQEPPKPVRKMPKRVA
jgi:hypothetical protein